MEPKHCNFIRRWLKFNTVGAMGIGVQLGVLALLRSGLGLHYLAATALAVETAVLHNFVWHERWTWAERTRASRGLRFVLERLLRFHLAAGFLSIASNLCLMSVLVGKFRLNYLLANIGAIAVTSLANFLMSEFLVFRETRPKRFPVPSHRA